MTDPARPPVRAPQVPDTLDTLFHDGRPLDLAALRGRMVLLDFWTYG